MSIPLLVLLAPLLLSLLPVYKQEKLGVQLKTAAYHYVFEAAGLDIQ